MKVFLFHKYIPGFASEYPAETYIAPDWLPVAGHMFDPDCSLETLLTKGCDQGVKADPGRPADPTHG